MMVCIIEQARVSADKAEPRLFLCDSKNKPPAMQGEGRSLDISNLLC